MNRLFFWLVIRLFLAPSWKHQSGTFEKSWNGLHFVLPLNWVKADTTQPRGGTQAHKGIFEPHGLWSWPSHDQWEVWAAKHQSLRASVALFLSVPLLTWYHNLGKHLIVLYVMVAFHVCKQTWLTVFDVVFLCHLVHIHCHKSGDTWGGMLGRWEQAEW